MKTIQTFVLSVLAISAWAQEVDSLKYCVRPGAVAVGGYDPVSYFKQSKPDVGSEKITFKFDGVEYRFASDENRKRFAANPTKYLPQFGGWCSMTLAMGRATKPVYDNFLIANDKLYLFERTLSVNGRELWLNDPATNEKAAAKNYNAYKKTGKIK